MNNRKIVIDGSCIKDEKFNGAQRYAMEILIYLDKLVPSERYEILIKPEYKNLIVLNNIKKVEMHAKNKLQWIIKVFFYLRKNKAFYIHFANGLTFWRDSIITLHDIYAFYDVYNNTWINNLKKKCKAIIDVLVAKHIVTVSEFSKQTMIDKLPINKQKISVIYNGWQHLESIEADETILKKVNLAPQSYYFFLGRLVNNKNIKWIYNVADRNPDNCFVIAGALYDEIFDFYKGKYENIIYTGYVNDNEMKALYKNCKAFLFPSIMEGFGIPPMEALFNGVPIIISNTSSLPEIYEDCAHYIDPYKYDYSLDELLKEPVASSDKVLNKFSWEKSAKQWYELIERCSM